MNRLSRTIKATICIDVHYILIGTRFIISIAPPPGIVFGHVMVFCRVGIIGYHMVFILPFTLAFRIGRHSDGLQRLVMPFPDTERHLSTRNGLTCRSVHHHIASCIVRNILRDNRDIADMIVNCFGFNL